MKDLKEKELNSRQLQAVRHGKGPLLIIAGAGTGKTTVITERIKWLIASGKAKTQEILALTFTEKASREMEERVDLALPYGYTDMWISTFHSFCDRVLRQEAVQIGLDPGYRLMTGAETIQFLTTHLYHFELDYFRPLGNPVKFIGGMLQHFNRLKDEDVGPDEYFRWVKAQALSLKSRAKSKDAETEKVKKEEADKYNELANAYRKYEELKVKEGVMDFGDLIANTLKLFRDRKSVFYQSRKKFKYLLVDEFQDTNFAQYALLKLLAPPDSDPNLTVVGDDSQSIYKFRGAAVSNILQFMDDYPRARRIVLADNYRSSQRILDSARRLIRHNEPDTLEVKLGLDKDLRAVRRVKNSCLEFIPADRVENEAEAIVQKITELSGDRVAGRYCYSDFAILVRANNHAEPFTRALARHGLPYQFLGPGRLFRQAEVKDLIAYLKVLYNFEDNLAFYRVLSLDHLGLSGRDLAAVVNFSKRGNLSLFEAAERIEKAAVAAKTKKGVEKLVKMIHRHLELVPRESAGQILYYFLEDSGLLLRLAEAKTAEGEKKAQNVAKFFDRLKTYEAEHEDASVHAVVDWLNLSMNLGESPLASDSDWFEENRINLLTIHSAKGLEFPVVFLVNLVTERFPTRERREQIPIPEELIKEILPVGNFHEQEERRLFYVGMTRAKDHLFLTAARYYGEGKRGKKISPFVPEALREEAVKLFDVSRRESSGDFQGKQLSFLDWKKPAGSESDQTIDRQRPAINYLSYSQIDTFNTCPRQYRFRYIQRIPVPSSAAASFGTSVHLALNDFYQLVKEGKRPGLSELPPLLSANWKSVGYASKAHEAKTKKEGERMLKNFYRKSFKPGKIPLSLEQVFVVKVSRNLRVGGKIDRVDETRKGLEIWDYKTGRVMSQKDVDKSLQMTLYALAATDEGIFAKKAEEVTLSFYFLDSGEKKSTKRSVSQLEKAKEEIIEKAGEISESDFQPTPGMWCDWCDFKLLCEAWS